MWPTAPGLVDRPGDAHARRRSRPYAPEPGLVEDDVDQLDRGVERRDRRVVDVELEPPLGEHRRRQVGRRRREGGVAEVDAEGGAGRGSSRSSVGGLPRPRAGARLARRLLDDEPRCWSSATSEVIVVRDRPVTRASSLRLAVPC